MAICDIYTATSATNVTTSTTSATPILQLATAATKRGFVVGIRVSIGTTAAAAGNNTLFQLARVANTTGGEAGGTGAANVPNDSAAPNPQSSGYSSWTTAPTVGSVLWQMELPQTTGSSWEEFPPLGYEWVVPANALHAGVAVFATSSVSTSTPVYAELVYGE